MQSKLPVLQLVLYRLLNRLENFIFPRILQERVETYPLLSCDSYALHCEFQVFRGLSEREFIEELDKIELQKVIFIPGRFTDLASKILKSKQLYFDKIIVGDDDITQSKDSLKSLAELCKYVYSVNLISESEYIRPLPLGIESPSYRSGGRLKNFERLPSITKENRPLSFLVAWNNQTNIEKRTFAAKSFEETNDTYIFRSRVPAQLVHKMTRRTLFVPCPAGNGLDTHRIWESLYLGSIPVILEQDLFCGVTNWPILVVKKWSDITRLSRLELEELYLRHVRPMNEIIQKSIRLIREIEQ